MSLDKLEQGNIVQKTQEVYYVTENVSLKEEVWEHEEEVEEHAEDSCEEKLAPLGKTVVLSEENVLSSPEKTSQRDQKSELRGEISVTDNAMRTETRAIKYKISPKREETEESQPVKEITAEAFVRTIESQTEEFTNEKRDSTSVIVLPDTKAASKQETSVTVKSQRELTVKTESKGRQAREQQDRKTEESSKERESVKDIRVVSDTVETSARARKQAEKMGIDRKGVAEESTERVTDVIERRTEPMTISTTETKEFTVQDRPVKVLLTQEEIVDDRNNETQMKPLARNFRKEETNVPGKVLVKKDEVAERRTYHDTTDTKKENVPDLDVKPKESVTDIKLQKPKVKQKAESKSGDAQTEGHYKAREEALCIPPQRGDAEKNETLTEDMIQTKSSVASKPAEKKRTSPQTSSRGTESKSVPSITFE